jgi:hypothetical protein
MTVDAAYTFLQLSFDADENDLTASYRRLVKNYHPDLNAHRPDWSNEMMFLLNEALLVAREYQKNRKADLPGNRSNDLRQAHEQARAAAAGAAAAPATDNSFQAGFSRIADGILVGIHTYYNYSLENVHLRMEGSRKFRYRSSIKRVRDGINRLNDLLSSTGPAELVERARLFRDFSKAFLQNMLIEKFFMADGHMANHKSWQHYWRGSEVLDRAIKDAFFKADFSSLRHVESLSLSEHEFMIILTKFSEGGWLHETLIKLCLLEIFLLLKAHLRRAGIQIA